MDLTNPYASPGEPKEGVPPTDPAARRRVERVAFLLRLQGFFDLLVGLAYAVMALTTPRELWREQLALIPVLGFFVAPLLGVAGGLKLAAAAKHRQGRGRTLVTLALFSCLVSLFTCTCAPLALGVLVYGLVVHRGQDAERSSLASPPRPS